MELEEGVEHGRRRLHLGVVPDPGQSHDVRVGHHLLVAVDHVPASILYHLLGPVAEHARLAPRLG